MGVDSSESGSAGEKPCMPAQGGQPEEPGSGRREHWKRGDIKNKTLREPPKHTSPTSVSTSLFLRVTFFLMGYSHTDGLELQADILFLF